jgi:hypothetical protein
MCATEGDHIPIADSYQAILSIVPESHPFDPVTARSLYGHATCAIGHRAVLDERPVSFQHDTVLVLVIDAADGVPAQIECAPRPLHRQGRIGVACEVRGQHRGRVDDILALHLRLGRREACRDAQQDQYETEFLYHGRTLLRVEVHACLMWHRGPPDSGAGTQARLRRGGGLGWGLPVGAGGLARVVRALAWASQAGRRPSVSWS